MKKIPISTARTAGENSGAQRVAIIAIDADGNYCITTWGKTRADCKALAKWSGEHNTKWAVFEMKDA